MPATELRLETLCDSWLIINGQRGQRGYPLSRTSIRDAVRDYGYQGLTLMDHTPNAWGARKIDEHGEPLTNWVAAYRTEDEARSALCKRFPEQELHDAA